MILHVYATLGSQITGENCLQTGNGNSLPNFTDYGGGGGGPRGGGGDGDRSPGRGGRGGPGGGNNRILRHNQAIITSYKFDCDQICGNITVWGVGVYPGGSGYQNTYTLNLQVWRPSPTVDDSTGTGQYSLVGNNKFSNISLVLSTGLVARVTPSPQDYVQFQPGDVLGFYVEEARYGVDGVVVLTNPSIFASEVVWYASIDPAMATSQSVYSVGNSGEVNSLTRAAPVISISTGKPELKIIIS